jgi:CheY-like chemotaxis protein/predicted DNA-binding transcriptional regulator AlpA
MEDRQYLNSWKEVADYVGRSARTLQRWEKSLKLPMHRPAGRMRSAVIALRAEIDEWIRQTPVAGSTKVAVARRTAKPNLQDTSSPTIENGLPLLLSIDEDVDSGNVRKQFLESNGYQVLTATDGGSGVKLFENNRIALVLLNCCQETLDGEVVARMLKRRKPKVPIVIVMGVKELPVATRRLADRVVAQASGSDELLSTIRRWA